jgi:hypothetical protein
MVVAKDADGKDLCSIDRYESGTSRNAFAPSNGWASNVDVIETQRFSNVIFVKLSTKEPAGTTALITINGVLVSETPFSYTQI